jgi:hypothetical protein
LSSARLAGAHFCKFTTDLRIPSRRAGADNVSHRWTLRELHVQRLGAQQILQALVEGFDPLTGDELPSGTVLQQAEVMRALLAGIHALEAGAARAQRRAQLPANVGRPWSADEEIRLVTGFHSGEPFADLARRHGRTLTAIEARLEKLGLLTEKDRQTQNRFISDRRAARRSKRARQADEVPADEAQNEAEDELLEEDLEENDEGEQTPDDDADNDAGQDEDDED